MPRPIWKGHISFGLVMIPVTLSSAEAREETKLFTADPSELGPAFAKHFEDDVVLVALPDRVAEWRDTSPAAHS